MEEFTKELLAKVIHPRPAESHKGDYGKVVLIGGNQQYGGAIMMSAEACVYGGAGLTTVATHPKNHVSLHARLPEVMVLDWQEEQTLAKVIESADVILIGPGLGEDEHAKRLLHFVLQTQKEQWLVIDGSAITLFSEGEYSLPKPEKTIFTPHQMEWQRLSGIPVEKQEAAANQRAQQKIGATIVLKSHRTEIYTADKIYKNPAGDPAMATGGMGDTLAGIITAFLGQFSQDIQTISAAVYLHSLIGDQLAQDHYVVLPTAISHLLPIWMKKIAENS